MLTKANLDGRHQEANAILKRIQETRLKCKLRRTAKKLEGFSVGTKVGTKDKQM